MNGGTVRINCRAKEHNAVSTARVRTRTQEAGALTMRPPRLHVAKGNPVNKSCTTLHEVDRVVLIWANINRYRKLELLNCFESSYSTSCNSWRNISKIVGVQRVNHKATAPLKSSADYSPEYLYY